MQNPMVANGSLLDLLHLLFKWFEDLDAMCIKYKTAFQGLYLLGLACYFLEESEMNDLDEVLRQLPAPDIKLLTRDLKVSCPDGTQKSDMVAACIKHCKKQKGLFGSSLQPFMLKK